MCSAGTATAAFSTGNALEFSTQEHFGLYFYAYLDYTYPVPNVNYRDCSSQSAIDTPLFGLIDKIVADGLPGMFAPRDSAMCFAYQAASSRLGVLAGRRSSNICMTTPTPTARRFLPSATPKGRAAYCCTT